MQELLSHLATNERSLQSNMTTNHHSQRCICTANAIVNHEGRCLHRLRLSRPALRCPLLTALPLDSHFAHSGRDSVLDRNPSSL